jgi:hypothetical protein
MISQLVLDWEGIIDVEQIARRTIILLPRQAGVSERVVYHDRCVEIEEENKLQKLRRLGGTSG